MIATKLFKDFFESEKTGGFLLIISTIISLSIANSFLGEGYQQFWQNKLFGLSIEHWVNDALMAIFFLLIGLELEREIYIGELSKVKDAMLPIFAAVGGMLVPASLFIFFNYGTPYQAGAGVPMATDIAFALGVLSLLGNRVPVSLKVFLTALAVIDDLGAIIVIAIFYTKTIYWNYLFMALGMFVVLIVLNRLKIRNLIPYIIGGIIMWVLMLQSGVHATITGVLLAFAIPFGNGDEKSSSYILQHVLHKPVAFIIMPIFALANTAILMSGNFSEIITHPISLGIGAGLVLGKPLGITVFSAIAVAFGLSKLPSDLKWVHILGAGLLAGIGFTMSIFITLLAFTDAGAITQTKIAILISSLIAGTLGFLILKYSLSNEAVNE